MGKFQLPRFESVNCPNTWVGVLFILIPQEHFYNVKGAAS